MRAIFFLRTEIRPPCPATLFLSSRSYRYRYLIPEPTYQDLPEFRSFPRIGTGTGNSQT